MEAQANSSDVQVKENDKEETTDLKTFETPAYYTVFKLILNFLPLKEINWNLYQ